MQTMLTLGILIASLVGYGFVQYVNHGWQYVQVAFLALLGTANYGLLTI
jgi:uncharacterized membrane protein